MAKYPSQYTGQNFDTSVRRALSEFPGQISTLNTKVAALEEDVDDLSGLPAQVATIGSKLDEIEQTIDGRNINGLDDFENLSNGYYLDVNDGVVKRNDAAMYATNDYYPLTKGDVLKYGLSGSAPWGLVCFYDTNKNFKSSVAGQGYSTLVEGVHTATDDLEYVRFCYLNQVTYIKKEYITITHNSIPRLKSAEDSIISATYRNKYFSAGVPSMLGKEYFHLGSLQGSGNGAPSASNQCLYSTPIPYTPCKITISTNEISSHLTGIRIQVRNDNDFSGSEYNLVYTGYSFPNVEIELPYNFKYVSFGFACDLSLIDYTLLNGVTITSDKDWSIEMPNLAEHIEVLENRTDVLEKSLEDIDKDINGVQNAYPNKKLSNVPGMFDSEITFVTFPIPAKAGDVVRWTPTILNSVLSVYMNQYDADGNLLGSWNNHTADRYCTLENDATAYIMATLFYAHQDDAKIYVNGELAWSNPIFSQGQEERIEALENESENNIITRNNPAQTTNILQQWSAQPKVGRTSTYAPTSPLVLLHFSDIHGDTSAVERIIQYKSKYSTFINDVIHTGDSHYNTWADGFTLWEVEGASSFLNTIGNHDTAYIESGTYDWTHYVGLEAYNRFFAPYIANWGVVQPTDAAANGYCYYYKDYSNCGIRLVVIDDMGWDNTQLAWFQSVVNDTLTNGLGLIVSKHYPMTSNNYIALEWTSVIDQKAGSLGGSSNNDALIAIIDTFIANGGNFICWLNGHTHRDIFTMVGADNKQLCVTISTATTRQPFWDECLKVAGTKSEDLFNLISFDSYLKIVKVLRVGNDYNYYGQHRGTITIDYTNGNVISQV